MAEKLDKFALTDAVYNMDANQKFQRNTVIQV